MNKPPRQNKRRRGEEGFMIFKREKWELRQMQALPMQLKVLMSAERVKSWYEHFSHYDVEWGDDGPPGVYQSFSGGKDSTVLRHIIQNHCYGVYDCPIVFVDTGLEYPEVRNFAIANADVVLRPKMNFRQVLMTYGYPVIGKNQARYIRDLQNAHGQNNATVNLRLTGYNRQGRYCPTMKLADKWHFLKDAPFKISEQCCDVMKKEPMRRYQKETGRMPIVGTMCSESQSREKAWLQNGCNAFDAKYPQSRPLSFWHEKDILMYLLLFDVPYASVYGEIKCTYKGEPCSTERAKDILLEKRDSFAQIEVERDFDFFTTGVSRTGCMFCAFGAHLEHRPNRFQQMKITHPKQYDYCMRPTDQGGLGMAEVLDYIGVDH